MSARRFANSAFNRITLVHALFELSGLLIVPALLQKLVVLTNHDGAMRLSGGDTLRAQGTVVTMVTPFKAKSHFLILGLH